MAKRKVTIENYFIHSISKSDNMLVPWYLMAAHAYYVDDNPILSDEMFDRTAKKILAKWGIINHMHKHLLDIPTLEAGSYLGPYPSMVVGALEDLRKSYVR